MGIPVTRNTTYIPGVTEVKSADLNGMQDVIAGVVPHLFDDFWGNSGAWDDAGDGSIAYPSGIGHFLAILSGATSGDSHRLTTKTVMGKGTDLLAFRARVKLKTAVTSRFDNIGYVRTSGAHADQLVFQRDTGVSNNWNLLIWDGASLTTVDTGFAPTVDVFYVLEAVWVDSTHVAWSISSVENGTALASGTETVGAVSAADDLWFEAEASTATSANRILYVDYISAKAARPA